MSAEYRRILWIDDEIEFLTPHISFLGKRGYDITPVANPHDGLSLLEDGDYDAVLLDHLMPGMDGLTVLSEIKRREPRLPVIMVTKNEEHDFIADAVGNQVDDLLTKPLTPSQIASTLTLILEQSQIREQRAIQSYITDFNRRRIASQGPFDWRMWIDLYQKLTEWDLCLNTHPKLADLRETHDVEKAEFNAAFANYYEKHYLDWLAGIDSPPLTVDVFSKYVVPHIERGRQVFFVVVDCMRLDQWLTMERLFQRDFHVARDFYYSIIPSATLYARHALFSGLFPDEIAKRYPSMWRESDAEHTSVNRHEKALLRLHLERLGLILKPRPHYFKIFDSRGETEYYQWLSGVNRVSLAAIVVDFLDILIHRRSEDELLRQLIPDEAALCRVTEGWYRHSGLAKIFELLAERNAVIVLTSDHGSILCNRAARVSGSKTTSSGLRFKVGDHLHSNPESALLIDDPASYHLPADMPRKKYLVAKEDHYFVYPNQFNEYKRHFQGGFQHGGISMEELILPVITLEPR